MIERRWSDLQEPSPTDAPLFVLANGRYAVLEPLGEGGTATVHRCVDRDLGVQRAIKLRRVREEDIDTAMVQRLADEARVMARLDHPHILPVYDVGMDQGWQYVVMELAAGSLSDRVKGQGAISGQEALTMLLHLLDALDTAHAAGVVHRDIKPHNVLIAENDGKVLLADWGIALLGDRDQTLTRTGMAMGSVSYMAPEQRLDAHDVGPPADVYAAGAMLYNLVTRASPVDLFTAKEGSPRWDGVPEPLIPVLQKACAYEVADRYATAGELAAALREVHEAMPHEPLANTGESDREPHGTLAIPATQGVTRATMSMGGARRWVAPVGLVLLAISVGTLVVSAGWWATQEPDVRTIVQAPPDLPPPDVPTTAPAPDPEAPEPPPDVPVDPEPAAATPTPVRDEPATVAAGTADPEPEPIVDEPEPTSVAVLPIHGPWKGSVEGAVTRLQLDGPTDRLRGSVSINAPDGQVTVPVTGTFGAQAGRLVLQVGGDTPASGTWTCDVTDDRMRGTVARAAGTDLVPVSLTRVRRP